MIGLLLVYVPGLVLGYLRTAPESGVVITILALAISILFYGIPLRLVWRGSQGAWWFLTIYTALGVTWFAFGSDRGNTVLAITHGITIVTTIALLVHPATRGWVEQPQLEHEPA